MYVLHTEPYHIVVAAARCLCSKVLSAAKSHIKRAANCSIIHGSSCCSPVCWYSQLMLPATAAVEFDESSLFQPPIALWRLVGSAFHWNLCARWGTKPPCLSWKLRVSTICAGALMKKPHTWAGLVIMISVTYGTLLVSAMVAPLSRPLKGGCLGDVVQS